MVSDALFSYVNPTHILCGGHALNHLPYELTQLNGDLPMILCDTATPPSVLRKLTGAFKGSGLTLTLLENVPPAPDDRELNEITDFYLQNRCNALMIVGNGAVVNTARLLALTLADSTRNPKRFSGRHHIEMLETPLVQIPFDIYTPRAALPLVEGEDWRAVSPHLLPDLAVIDPAVLTQVAPLKGIAAALMSLWICAESVAARLGNPITDSLAGSVIPIVSDYLWALIDHTIDEDWDCLLVQSQLVTGAIAAGSKPALLPRLTDVLVDNWGGEAGIWGGVLIPYTLELIARQEPGSVSKLLVACQEKNICAVTAEELKPRCTINIFYEVMQQLNQLTDGHIPTTLEEGGVPFEALEKISQTDELKEMKTENWNSKTCLKLLTHAWRGTPIAISASECSAFEKKLIHSVV